MYGWSYACIYTDEAKSRSYELLRSWLSPLQLMQLEYDGRFEVRGSDGGRYVISDGSRYFNVREKNKDAWHCFVPAGSLPPGDIMLAQKIALETDEEAAITCANHRIQPFTSIF